MEIKKPNSHTPIVHDNTEKDLILVPPSVLDGKVRDFEEQGKMRLNIPNEIALALAFIIPIFTATFDDYVYVKGATIRGFFIAGFVFIIARLIYNGYHLSKIKKYARIDLINSFTIESIKKTKE